MKFIVVGDPHIRLRSIRSRNDDIISAFEDKFKQINELVIKHNADYVICTGDLLDRASCTVETLTFAERMINTLSVPMVLTVGNHSLLGNTMNNFDKSMISLLDRLCENLIIKDRLEFDNCILHMNHYGNDNFIIDNIDNSKANIIVSHSMIVQKAFFHCILATEVKTNADLILNGHNHMNFMIGKVYNAGALIRLTSAKGDMDREVEVGILEVTDKKLKLTRHKLDIRRYQDVFDVKTNKAKIERLSESIIKNIDDSMKSILTNKELFKIVSENDKYTDDVLTCANEYITKGGEQ